MGTHVTSGTVVVMEQFDPVDYLRLIEGTRITISRVIPTVTVRMSSSTRATNTYDTSSAQRRPQRRHASRGQAQDDRLVRPVIQYYAGTDNGFVYYNSEQWLAHPSTVGSAVLGVIHIVGEDGEEVPVGEEGTIYFESETQFEYHGDPEKTQGSRLANGWSTLGDVGKVDEDGFLYLTDRKAYMIITGGVNVYPQEAENVLTMHPKVADVAVIGVPNEDFGEEVKAVVQPVEMPADDDAASALARVDRLLQGTTRRREVSAIGRLQRRTAASPDRQSSASAC